MTSLSEVLAHPIVKSLNPEGKHFMDAVELSPKLNPFARHNLRMFALIPFKTFPHIKAIPAFQMMLEDFKAGRYKGKHTLVVDSSGNTAHAAARLAPAFGFKRVKIVLSTDVPESKKGILEALSSVELIQVPTGVAARAREEGAREGHYHLNQYSHFGNITAHEKYTGPEVARALGGVFENIAAVAAAMGSGGTIGGTGEYFTRKRAKTKIVGVRPKLGEQVPGARDERRMAEVVTLPWQDFTDVVFDIGRKQSFISMRELWSEVEPQPGPTSGLAYAGLMAYLSGRNPEELAGKSCGFICPDDGRFYSERTTGELDPDQGVLS